ncbi:MAG: hypothetical protein LKF96_04025 [Treponema sp.]|jgi:hypothetical protein|nr:hypothetical protein [Treponema sp.]
MALQIIMKRNNLETSRKRVPYLFTSREAGKIGLGELLDEAGNSHTTVTRADLAACVSILMETARRLLRKGYRVEFPFVDLYVKAVGTAPEIRTPFTPKRRRSGHTFTLHALVHKKEAASVTANVIWERLLYNAPSSMPHIDRFSYNREDSVIVVNGRNLDFNPQDGKSGASLSPMNGSAPIVLSRYYVRRSSEIVAPLPPLVPGPYYFHLHSHGNTVSELFEVLPAGKPDATL